MIKTGLVSISFRELCCEEIIELARQSGLESIEWGGDVHVPPGDIENAKRVAELTVEAGLTVSAYGSYYRVGTYGNEYKKEFGIILDTAVALGAPIIRIWAGVSASSKTDETKRAEINAECKAIAQMASKKSIKISFECHRNTLTDDFNSSLRLMEDTARDNLKMYWQPNEEKDFEYNLEALQKLLPYLTNVHVFNWPEPGIRKPLADGEKKWRRYLEIIAADSEQHICSLEFVPDNEPTSLSKESETLKKLTADIG